VNNIQIVQTFTSHVYLKTTHFNVYGQTYINILLNHVVLCLSYMIHWGS